MGRCPQRALRRMEESSSHGAASRCRNFANSAAKRKSIGPRMISDRQHLRETCNKRSERAARGSDRHGSGFHVRRRAGHRRNNNYREMKAAHRVDGPGHMMALEEFNECEQRFTFLTRERDEPAAIDRGQPAGPLPSSTSPPKEKVLSTPSTPSTRASPKPFHTILRRRHGGDALDRARQLRRTRASTSSHHLRASACKNVLLLSGGDEKAMTALALLIAIFRYQP